MLFDYLAAGERPLRLDCVTKPPMAGTTSLMAWSGNFLSEQEIRCYSKTVLIASEPHTKPGGGVFGKIEHI